MAYRYRRWKLDNDMYLVARCEVQSVMEFNNQKMNKYRSHPPKPNLQNPSAPQTQDQIFDASSASSKLYELLIKDIVLMLLLRGSKKEQVEDVRKEAESQVMMKRLEERIRALEEKSIGNAAGEDP
ncbi:hypothetical protein QQ045_012418 [Rhodiola kirilowii]